MNRNINVLKNALDLLKSYLDTYATDNQDFVYHQLAIEALSDIEQCEPVGELILDPAFMPALKSPLVNWKINLVDLEVGTKLYTSPQPRDWVGLTDKRIEEIAKLNGAWQLYSSLKIFDFVANINDELKQLNTKG